jgi:pectate lyase
MRVLQLAPHSSRLTPLTLTLLLMACSGDKGADTDSQSAAGGTTSTSVGGTAANSGGTISTAMPVGGTTASTSSTAIGVGGVMAAGGTLTNAGGAPATGGTATSGGTEATGGLGSGGASATSTGGTPSTGGTANISGTSAKGGSSTTGGSNAKGGSSATGGATGTGGGATSGVVGKPIGFATLNGGTTGGLGGQVVTATTFAQLKSYAESTTTYVILVSGTITNGTAGGKISIKSNKSLVGVGSTAFLSGVGLEVSNSNNVIIQNLKITLVGTTTPSSVNGGDAIAVNGTSKNVWIDHCELYSEDPTVQTNIDKYDGLIDVRDQTGFVTISWNFIHDHHKTCLVGASDTDLYDDRKITFHHNYFKNIVKRAPEYRGATGHFFNNYVVGISTTGATFVLDKTCLRVEKNIYETVKYSIYSQTGATIGYAERIDNIESQSRAYPTSCTASIPYDYSSALTATTSTVKTLVPQGAGVGKI